MRFSLTRSPSAATAVTTAGGGLFRFFFFSSPRLLNAGVSVRLFAAESAAEDARYFILALFNCRVGATTVAEAGLLVGWLVVH